MPATATHVPQQCETAPSAVRRERFAYRFAYGRSADSRTHDAPGQDYLALCDDGARFAFAVCDGVSQSFLGDVAARIIGDELVRRLWNAPLSDDAEALRDMLESALAALTTSASRVVASVELPPDSPPMLVEVLEQKRELGSESTFAAGLIDPTNDRLVLTWMGDSRIRMWGKAGELTETALGSTFLTRERWSTSRGPIGHPHVFVGRLRDCQHIAVYSDGLPMLDERRDIRLSNRQLADCMSAALQSSTSDDMSYLEIVPSADRGALDSVVKEWGTSPLPPRPRVPPDKVTLPVPRGFDVSRRKRKVSASITPITLVAAAVLLIGLFLTRVTAWPPGQQVAVTDFSTFTALAGTWRTRAAPGAPGQNAQCNDLDNAHASALVVQAGAPANASIHAQLRLTSQGADLGMGLLARVNAAGTNYYLATLSPSSSVVDLRKVVNGAASQLASVQIAAAASPDWPQLRLDVTGDHLQVFAGAQTIIDVKDPSLAEGGVGLWAGAGSTACFGEVYVRAL